MKMLALISLGVVAIAIGLAVWWHAGSLGFPDGHLTEYERAYRPFGKGFALLSGSLGIVVILFSWKTQNKRTMIRRISAFYLSVLLGFVLIIFWLGQVFDNGVGA